MPRAAEIRGSDTGRQLGYLARDQALLAVAREEAKRIVAADPALRSEENAGLVKALEERWQGRLSLARVG